MRSRRSDKDDDAGDTPSRAADLHLASNWRGEELYMTERPKSRVAWLTATHHSTVPPTSYADHKAGL